MPTIATTTWLNACLLVLAGGFAAQHSRVALNSDLCQLLFVASVALIAVRRVRWVAFAALGYALFVIAATQVVEARLSPEYAGDSMLTRVVIRSIPRVTAASLTLEVTPVSDRRLPDSARVSWYDPPQVPEVGEIWQLELRLRRPRGSSNAGVFDVEHWLFRNRVLASGYVVPGQRNQRLAAASRNWLEAYRARLLLQARQHAGSSAAVFSAIAVGDRRGISSTQWQRYAATGTSHLMAISGLHIGLAASFAFAASLLACAVLRPRGNHLCTAAAAAFAAAVSYALVSGFAVPASRAVAMLGFATAALLLQRRADPLRIVAQAALLVFCANPLTIMAPGFGLSFAAVLVLLIAGYRYRADVRIRWLRELARMQTVLLFGLMPLTIAYFQRISIAAPAVNLVAVPLFSVITVPTTLCSMLLFLAWDDAAIVLLQMAAISIAAIEWLIGHAASVEFASHRVAVGGLLVTLPALWLLLPRGLPGRGLAVLGVIGLLLQRPAGPPPGCFDTRVLDVGQGLAVVVQSASSTLLFDTGASFRSGGSVAEQVIVPYFDSVGTGRIDTLVISHADDDHAGGAAAILQNLAVSRIYRGEALEPRMPGAEWCSAGTRWQADGIEFEFLHPGADRRLQGNDLSCVLLVSAGRHRLLLTGDIEVRGEQAVLTRLNVSNVDAVVVPHHGSLTSSAPAFVNRLGATYAIASAGYANRWGFPKARVAARWRGAGATFLTAAASGMISFRTCADDGLGQLRQERLAGHRFWKDS